MKKIIFYSFGYPISYQERIQQIKDACFDGVFVSLETSDKISEKEIQALMDAHLLIESLHLPAKDCVNSLWEEGQQGDCCVKQLKEGISLASKYQIKRVILHLHSRAVHPAPNELGLSRIKEVLAYCKEKDIFLCIENNRDMSHLFYVFERIKDDYLKFCLDLGHANGFTRNLYDFPKFSFVIEKLECLHIHDNDGLHDQHHLPFEGNIQWDIILPKLFKINPNLNLTLELHPYGINPMYKTSVEFLKIAFETLDKLSKYI